MCFTCFSLVLFGRGYDELPAANVQHAQLLLKLVSSEHWVFSKLAANVFFAAAFACAVMEWSADPSSWPQRFVLNPILQCHQEGPHAWIHSS